MHFYASPACDASGAGEGATPVGQLTSARPGWRPGELRGDVPDLARPGRQRPHGNRDRFRRQHVGVLALRAGRSDRRHRESVDHEDGLAGSGDGRIPADLRDQRHQRRSGCRQQRGRDGYAAADITLVSTSTGSCSGTTTITCTLGSLASGSQITVSIVVTPTAAGDITNTATVSAAGTDNVPGNNSASTTTTVVGAGPSTLIVTNTASTGAGSLRQAILDANAQPGPDLITFNIPGAGVRHDLHAAAADDYRHRHDRRHHPAGLRGHADHRAHWRRYAAWFERAGRQHRRRRNPRPHHQSLARKRHRAPGPRRQRGRRQLDWHGLGRNDRGWQRQRHPDPDLRHVVGGSTAADRNVISGNTIGVNIGSASARGNVVIGNYIGTDFTGALDVGNTDAGVHVISEANTIGGQAAGSGNVISGNDQVGVRLAGGATANSVLGNVIGLNASGTGALGNGIGVHADGASTNEIGGLAAGAGNEIAFSSTIGVLVGQGSTNNAIFGNAIHQNGTLGMDLVGDGATANDPGDIDEGANDRMNFPVLSAAAGGVPGTLNSFPDSTFRIEFFGNLACDASGHGEGQLFLGSTAVTTDATGNATIPLFAAAVGQFITATATDSSSNTSEFSACVTPLGPTAEIAVSVTDSPDPVVVGGQLSYTVTVNNNGPSPATNVRLTAVWNGPFNVDATSPAGTCELTPLLVCTFGTLQSGANATLGIVGTPGPSACSAARSRSRPMG